MLDPPIFAEVTPRIAKKIRVKPYSQYSILLRGAKSTIPKGRNPPTVKEAPEAMAAWMGFA
jgi:hypothetical protein